MCSSFLMDKPRPRVMPCLGTAARHQNQHMFAEGAMSRFWHICLCKWTGPDNELLEGSLDGRVSLENVFGGH